MGTSAAVMTGSKVFLGWLREGDIPDPNALSGNEILPDRTFKPGNTDRTIVNVVGTNPGGASIYLMGWIVYTDERGTEFGDTHTTYFLRQWNGRRFEIPSGFPDWDFQF